MQVALGVRTCEAKLAALDDAILRRPGRTVTDPDARRGTVGQVQTRCTSMQVGRGPTCCFSTRSVRMQCERLECCSGQACTTSQARN